MSNKSKYININDEVIVAITTVAVGIGSIIYAKTHEKDTSIAAIIGTYAGTAIGKIITSK